MDEPYPRLMGNKANHAMKLQQHLHDQMLAQSEFCDVELLIGDVTVKAHWCVLVSCPYFQSLYDSGMTEKMAGKVNISVGKPAALRSAISFLYNGMLEISYETVRDILEVADYFQIEDLKKECANYLSSVTVTVENCINLSLLSSLYDLDIYTKVFDFVRGHLPQVMQQSETLTLTPDSIVAMLTDKSLNYVTQEEFYKFIVRWVKHDSQHREKHFPSMFCSLDLHKLPGEFLEKTVETEPLVGNSDECKVHVLNSKMKRMTGLVEEYGGTRDLILLVGGCGQAQYFNTFLPFFPFSDAMSVNNLYGYIVQEDRWVELAPLPYQMRRPLAAFDKASTCLYVYDTSTGSTMDTDSVFMYKFNIVDNIWTSMKISLPDLCCDISVQHVVNCGGRLYLVASGRFSEDCTPHGEWYTCLLQVSEDGTNSQLMYKLFARTMKTQVQVCAVADTFVCILGWKCGTKKAARAQKLARFIYIDTRTDKKYDYSKGATFEPLMFPMGWDLYLTKPGAYRVRRFSFRDRKWFNLKEQFLPLAKEEPARSDYIHISYGDHVYMFGGKSAKTKKPIDQACRLDVNTKKWEDMQQIPQPLSNSAVCVASVPVQLTRCHIDCPHCLYYSVRSRATYLIDFPDDEEDEEDDNSYDPDDLNSDFWDDDIYDPIDPYDWY